MAPSYPGQHSHFFLIIWANSSVPECAGLRGTTEKGLLISGSQVRALLGSPFCFDDLRQVPLELPGLPLSFGSMSGK
jgi:hypothetical protein